MLLVWSWGLINCRSDSCIQIHKLEKVDFRFPSVRKLPYVIRCIIHSITTCATKITMCTCKLLTCCRKTNYFVICLYTRTHKLRARLDRTCVWTAQDMFTPQCCVGPPFRWALAERVLWHSHTQSSRPNIKHLGKFISLTCSQSHSSQLKVVSKGIEVWQRFETAYYW